MTTVFSCRSARSGALAAGFAIVVVVETAVLHLWLGARHPVVAWTLTLLGLATLAWLADDWRAMGRGGVSVGDEAIALRVGRRFRADVPRALVVGATHPTWRDLPASEGDAAREFLDLTQPADPNVLLTLAAPTPVRLPGGIQRRVRQLALHLDDPQAFLAAVGGQRA